MTPLLIKSLLACFALLTSSAIGETWTVDDDGPADFNTIQAAIDAAAQTGDEIIVYPGTYRDIGNQVVLIDSGQNISIKSIAGPSKTFIDGEATRRGVRYVNAGANSTGILDGFTILNGFSTSDGGGIRIEGCRPTIVNCTITDCFADCFGGGISTAYSFIDANAQFENCIISNNSSSCGGGGISLDGSACAATFVNCEIRENQTIGDGGGIRFENSVAIFSSCTINSNNANRGGGLFVTTSDIPYLGNCEISSNTAVIGGAIFSESSIQLASATICENSLPQIIGGWSDDGDNQITEVCGLGACCTGNQLVCAMSNQPECELFGGTFLGYGTDCTDANCPTTCIGDANGDGEVSVNDILLVISQFGVTCP